MTNYTPHILGGITFYIAENNTPSNADEEYENGEVEAAEFAQWSEGNAELQLMEND